MESVELQPVSSDAVAGAAAAANVDNDEPEEPLYDYQQHPLSAMIYDGSADYHEVPILILDDDRIASAATDFSIAIWHLETGKVQKSLVGHLDKVTKLALMGKYLISGARDNLIIVWNHQKGTKIREIKHHRHCIKFLVPLDRTRVASASCDSTFRFCNIANGEVICTIGAYQDEKCVTNLIALSPHEIATTIENDLDCVQFGICIWNTYTGILVKTLMRHTREVTCILALSDSVLLSAAKDYSVLLWSILTHEVLVVLSLDRDFMTCMTFIKSNLVVMGSKYGKVCFINPVTTKVTGLNTQRIEPVNCIASLEGTHVVVGFDDGNLCIFAVADGKLVNTLLSKVYRITSIILAPRGHFLVGSYKCEIETYKFPPLHSGCCNVV